MTVKLPFAVFPRVSEAEQFTVVVVMANVLPDAGVHITVRAPSTLSVAVAEKLTIAPEGPVAWTVIFPGRLNIGATLSLVQPKVFPVHATMGV